MNKKISFPIAVIVVFIVTIIVGGIVLYVTKKDEPLNIPQKTILELPIDDKEEAIAFAKNDPDVQKWIKETKEFFGINSMEEWAHFDPSENYWAVGIYPDADISDVWYEIHFSSDGEILHKGPGSGY